MPLPAEILECSLVDLSGARGVGAFYQDAAVLVITEPVLEEILDYSDRGRRCEVGGFLLGDVSEEGKLPFVVIKHFHPAAQAVSGAASLTFTHETWADLHRQVEQKYPGELIVGWHHTHPGFGVFLSGYDQFIHRNFFPEPWQVALVVDPRRQEFGFFQWREGEVRDCGFLCAVGR